MAKISKKRSRKKLVQRDLGRVRLPRIFTPKEAVSRAIILCPDFLVKLLLRLLVWYKEL